MFLDCTLRDGGYYNAWDFPEDIVFRYLDAMKAAGVDVVELGLRSLINRSFKGAFAYTTDGYIRTLPVPEGLKVGVMVNASELISEQPVEHILDSLFPCSAENSPVDLVRIASHVHEFESALPAVTWLKERGYMVGFNLMQVADCAEDVIVSLARSASQYPLDVLYFADSMGSMGPDHAAEIIRCLRSGWQGNLGIHTHDNMGLALSNTLRAKDEGVTWLDATVTGMGRGPGNSRTEELAIELGESRGKSVNLVPLMALIREYFKPLQEKCGWGTNPFYYLSGKYGIHPTYIQEMLSDNRYSEEDVLAVIEHLRIEGGKKFSAGTLDAARHFYYGDARGGWEPASTLEGRDVLLLGTGPGVAKHRSALEQYILQCRPVVMALNTQTAIDSELIDYRVACHPVRLLADCESHTKLPQPLITPYSMLPPDVQSALEGKEILDFGLKVSAGRFAFHERSCIAPTSLVMAYTFSVAASGRANQILLAGFDGYEGVDPRNQEMNRVVKQYQESENAAPLLAITDTRYDVDTVSVYGLIS